jgi:hypothetical protein
MREEEQEVADPIACLCNNNIIQSDFFAFFKANYDAQSLLTIEI